MRNRLSILFVAMLLALLGGPGVAQEPDAKMLVQAALKAMGGENLRSVQYSGNEGYVAAVGQNYNPANDWPAPLITSYTRTIDYEAKSSREEYGLTTERPAPVRTGRRRQLARHHHTNHRRAAPELERPRERRLERGRHQRRPAAGARRIAAARDSG